MEKVKIIWRLIRSKKFMVITDRDSSRNIVTNYSDKEVTKSGKAIYFIT